MFQIKRVSAIMPAVEAFWQRGAANVNAFVLWNIIIRQYKTKFTLANISNNIPERLLNQ